MMVNANIHSIYEFLRKFLVNKRRSSIASHCSWQENKILCSCRREIRVMEDPKAALPVTLETVADTSTLGSNLSSLSITDESSNSSSPETSYQVFILAGFGHKFSSYMVVTNPSLYPLTEEDNYPKALLPIANNPLLFYPLQWCSQAGFPCTILFKFQINFKM